MATSNEERQEDSSPASEQLEEDASLSDLPHSFNKPDDQNRSISVKFDSTAAATVLESEEEFDFGSSMRGSSFFADTKMCAADELFFKGQILPLRLSVSSDCSGVLTKQKVPTRRLSASESIDGHAPCSMSGLKSISDGGSSTGISPNSSRSNSNGSTTSTATTNSGSSISIPKPRRGGLVRNQFYAHPSPTPQIQISNGARLEKVGSRRSQKSSSIWDFFRLGLVRTPDQDLNKVIRSNSARGNNVSSNRSNCVSRNSSVNSNNSTNLSTNNNNNNNNASANTVANSSFGDVDKNNDGTSALNSKNLKQKSRQVAFFSGCRCSFEAVASNAVVTKGDAVKEIETKHEKKVAAESKMKNKNKNKNRRTSTSKKKQEKHDMSHHRTYEWLKGL